MTAEMTVDALPLVSCIMPTYNRRGFVPAAIRYFLRQDYPNRELIIIDDGNDKVADLLPTDHRLQGIRYIRLNKKHSVGAKRNIGCAEASGEIIVHWDDDDWMAGHRLSLQVKTLLDQNSDVCGSNRLLFYDTRNRQAWEYVYPEDQRFWISGNTLCYRRSFWKKHKFDDINVGEDALFVWKGDPDRMSLMNEGGFHVAMIHDANASPKKTLGQWWRPLPLENIQRLLSRDWPFYRSEAEETGNENQPDIESPPTGILAETPPAQAQPTLRNVYACLVHEKPECILDLVRNLGYHDPDSTILLYNGGSDPDLLKNPFDFEQYNGRVRVHPEPRPMKWGWLHDFALDCMNYSLRHLEFDTLTIVDSDQLAVRPGYSQYLYGLLAGRDKGINKVGMLGNSPMRQPPSTRVPPAAKAFKEFDLWKPFLRKFPNGEELFVHWTFWPSTVFTRDLARDLTRLFREDELLKDILSRTQIWASEEVILPTLTRLLGYGIHENPCSYDFVKYRAVYNVDQLNRAFDKRNVFWIHPVERNYGNRLRHHIRKTFKDYSLAPPPPLRIPTAVPADFSLRWPVLQAMNRIQGWLDMEEAECLMAAAEYVLTRMDAPHNIVEVGSYCGRATVTLGLTVRRMGADAKVHAIDPHDGMAGALDQGLRRVPPGLKTLKRNIANAGLNETVNIIKSPSRNVSWKDPVSLLLIDGLHDYFNVAADFRHFESFLRPGGLVAFHDYADYFPGVRAFVDELIHSGRYRMIKKIKTLAVLEKKNEPL